MATLQKMIFDYAIRRNDLLTLASASLSENISPRRETQRLALNCPQMPSLPARKDGLRRR
jgi:hypothetical protein